MFDHILLILLLLADVLCWYEARQSGNVMKLYFLERKKWYAARSKKTETPISESNANSESPSPTEIESPKTKSTNAKSAGATSAPTGRQPSTTSTSKLTRFATSIRSWARRLAGTQKPTTNSGK